MKRPVKLTSIFAIFSVIVLMVILAKFTQLSLARNEKPEISKSEAVNFKDKDIATTTDPITQTDPLGSNLKKAQENLLSEKEWEKQVSLLEKELKTKGLNIRKTFWLPSKNYYEFLIKIKHLEIDTNGVEIIIDEFLSKDHFRIATGKIYVDHKVSTEEFINFLKN